MLPPAVGQPPRCAICHQPLQPALRHLYFGACSDWACRAAVNERMRQQIRVANQCEAAHHEARRELARRAAAAQSCDSRAPGFVAYSVPANQRPLVPLDVQRQRKFLRLLKEQIRSAVAAGPGDQGQSAATDEPVECQPLLPIVAQACAACGGACCLSGGDQAYLSAATIRRYLHRHPQATAAEIRAEYRSHLAHSVYEGSCVFHGAQGCTLPRDLRADICNRFTCRELQEIEGFGNNAPAAVFFAAIDDTQQLVRTRALVAGPPQDQ